MDGVTEWANCSIGQVLQTMVCNDQKNWANICPMVEFTLNSSVMAATGYMPFKLNYSYIPQLSQCIDAVTQYASDKQFTQQALWDLMAATMLSSRATRYKPIIQIAIEDQVNAIHLVTWFTFQPRA